MASSINKHGETLSNISVASGLYFFENDLISAIIPIRDVFTTLSNTSDGTFCENKGRYYFHKALHLRSFIGF